MERTLLEPGQLSAAAQRALGAGPARTMAARGLLPLPPAEQLTVLYQLAVGADEALAETARLTAAGLPEKLLAGTLADPALDPRVLDLFAELAIDRPAVFDAVVLNPAVADATVGGLASRGDARATDLIAQNEQRLLRHPEIIAALYMNRRARMATIDRVVELAVRNGVRVPGLACWDEIARALTGGPSGATDQSVLDVVLDRAPGEDQALTTGDADRPLPEDEPAAEGDGRAVPFRDLSIPAKIRAATLGDAFVRAEAVRDPIKMVAIAAIKSPGVSEIEAARYAANPNLCDDVIRFIAMKRDWTKRYGVKVSLCRNPKTPVAEVTRLLPFLRDRDLQNLIRSKHVPSAVVAQARKLHMTRTGGGKK